MGVVSLLDRAREAVDPRGGLGRGSAEAGEPEDGQMVVY
jgi:hypothetical protein